MKSLSSTEFRRTFAGLGEEVTVTVLGRPIAVYTPLTSSVSTANVSFTEVGVPGRPELRGNEASVDLFLGRRAQQRGIDATLARVNKRKEKS